MRVDRETIETPCAFSGRPLDQIMHQADVPAF